MLALMAPAMIEGHASLAGIGMTFAFFLWAAVAAGWARSSGREPAAGSIGDPLAMGLLMAAPFLAIGLGGHGHGGGATASIGPGATPIIGLLIVGGWTALRAGGARADRLGRFGFWSCLLMMIGMLVGLSIHA